MIYGEHTLAKLFKIESQYINQIFLDFAWFLFCQCSPISRAKLLNNGQLPGRRYLSLNPIFSTPISSKVYFKKCT